MARGRAGFRVRWVTYAGLGGYACAAVVSVLSRGDAPAVVAAVLIGGAVMFWLGRRSALESASAEAHAWAVATASAQATASALAGVQVNLNLDRGMVELTDATGLHSRQLVIDQPAQRGVLSDQAAAFDADVSRLIASQAGHDQAPDSRRGPSQWL